MFLFELSWQFIIYPLPSYNIILNEIFAMKVRQTNGKKISVSDVSKMST